jgi:hypothetical protein
MGFQPFYEGNTSLAFEHHLQSVLKEIRELDNGYVLRTSPAELERHYLEKVRIEPLILHIDQRYQLEPRTIPVDARHDRNRFFFPGDTPYTISGTELSLAIPYEGDKQLWKITPSHSISGCPEIEVEPAVIIFRYIFADSAAEQVELGSQIDRHLKALTENVQYLRRDVDQYNATAPDKVTEALQQKRTQALRASNVVASLGIPMKPRGEPATYIAPVQRRKLPVVRPAYTTVAYAPEPELEEAAYQHILKVTRSASMVMERDPASFATLGEEAIRSLMLLLLNGHYEGTATGETFNGEGKTDILIRVNDRNIFIAECKFWDGAAKFANAIDQLFDYLTWRDCRCALLVFNRQQSSSTVAQRMHEAMGAHGKYRKTVHHEPMGDSRYIFVKDTDPGRDIVITTQLFDVPR